MHDATEIFSHVATFALSLVLFPRSYPVPPSARCIEQVSRLAFFQRPYPLPDCRAVMGVGHRGHWALGIGHEERGGGGKVLGEVG